MKKSAVTPLCKFCEGAGESKEVYTSHRQFSQPKNGVLTCPKLLKYKCKLCSSHGHIEKRCIKPIMNKSERLEQFCRFCCNAKNPDFLNHNQFDKDGFVNCPVLLDIECQKCGGKGHTKRYCPELKTESIIVAPKKDPSILSQKKQANKFASLMVEEEEEEVDILQSGSLDFFPMLSEKQGVVNSMMGGWTNAVKHNIETARPKSAPPSRPPPHPKEVAKRKEEKINIPPCPKIPLPQPPVLDTKEEDEDDVEDNKTSTFLSKSWADEEW
jgi:hypothetical protein